MVSTAKLKYSKKDLNEKKTDDIFNFLRRPVKGCKRFRKRICGREEKNIPHNIVKFANNTETVIGYELSKKLNGFWNRSYFSTDTRTFLFKVHNNTAGYNNVVAHFVQGHSPNCTFCDISHNPDIENETPLHLFYACPTSERFLESIFTWILGTPTIVSRQEFFVGFNLPNFRQNDMLDILSAL